MTSPTHEETSISREVPAVFGEFSTKTGSILYYKDKLWSELIHLGEEILEQVRALEVLSADGEYTALLEAVRLLDDRFREPGCREFSQRVATILKTILGEDGYLAMRAKDASAFTGFVRRITKEKPDKFAQAIAQFAEGIKLAEEERKAEAQKDEESLRDTLKRLSDLTVSLPTRVRVKAAPRASTHGDQVDAPTAESAVKPADFNSDQMLFGENCLPLKDAAEKLGQIEGRKRAHSTIWRWARKGLKGVKLETRQSGGRLLTSLEALDRFTKRLAEQEEPPPAAAPKSRRPKPRSPKAQETAYEQAKRRLDAEGI